MVRLPWKAEPGGKSHTSKKPLKWHIANPVLVIRSGFNNPVGVVDFAEVDDTYAYKELQSLEALGFFVPGEAGTLTAEGFTVPDGALPVNVSGGSLGMGHLLDATGLARTLEAVLQLRGEAGTRQLEDVEIGLVQSWRGVPTTSGAVAVLSN